MVRRGRPRSIRAPGTSKSALRALRLARLRIRAAAVRLAKIETRHGLLTLYAKLNHAPVRHFSNLPVPDKPADALLDWIDALLNRLPRIP